MGLVTKGLLKLFEINGDSDTTLLAKLVDELEM